METAFDREDPFPAGFWIRLVAMLIDTALFAAVEFVLGQAASLTWGSGIIAVPLFAPTMGAFMLVLTAAYYVVLHTLYGQTVGKMLVRVRVVELDGRPLSSGTSFLRWLGYLLSGLPVMLGFVLAGLRRDKRALHDLVAGTRVVRVGP